MKKNNEQIDINLVTKGPKGEDVHPMIMQAAKTLRQCQEYLWHFEQTIQTQHNVFLHIRQEEQAFEKEKKQTVRRGGLDMLSRYKAQELQSFEDVLNTLIAMEKSLTRIIKKYRKKL